VGEAVDLDEGVDLFQEDAGVALLGLETLELPFSNPSLDAGRVDAEILSDLIGGHGDLGRFHRVPPFVERAISLRLGVKKSYLSPREPSTPLAAPFALRFRK
jgi:hypothetical protein